MLSSTQYRLRFSVDLIALLIFRLLLDISYLSFVVRYYEYANFKADLNLFKIILTYFLLVAFNSMLPKKSGRVSTIIVQLLFLFIYIPLQSYYALSNEGNTWFALSSLFWLIVFLLLDKINFRSLQIGLARGNMTWLYTIPIMLSLIAVGLVFYFNGINLQFDLVEVYEVRAKYNSSNVPGAGYLINWVAKIILPFLMLLFLFNRKRPEVVPFLISLLILLLIFMSSGHKSYFLGTIMTLGLAMVINLPKLILNLRLLLAAIVGISLGVHIAIGDMLIPSIFIRRLFFLPAQISYYYYDCFSEAHIYLSHSLLSRYIPYPHKLEPTHLVGELYMGSAETSANNGVVSDAYMNFGTLGIALWAIILVVLLKICDRVTEEKNKRITWPLLMTSFATLLNGYLFTTLLTHGLLLSLVIMMFLPRLTRN